MSHLWSKLRAQAWPAPRACTGIEVAGDKLIAVHAARVEEEWTVTHIAQESLSFVPFRGAPRVEDESTLALALQRLVGAQRQFQPIQFALPDPAGIFQILELESLPVTAPERNALGHFRLEKEWPAATKMTCVTQSLGVGQGHALMLVIAVDRAWLECLHAACRMAGIVPNAVDMTVCHVFNQLHETLNGQTSDGALLVMEPHAWTLLLWDKDMRPRFVRTRWRETSAGQASDHEAITIEVERLVRAYVLATPERKVGCLYVNAADTDAVPVTERLNSRMHTPCVRLDRELGLSLIPKLELDMLSPGALAAAVLRA